MEKQVFVTNLVTEINAADLEGVGNLRWVGENLYRWVQNKHGSALTVGNVCFHSFANLATSLTKVYDGATADLGFMAGVVMAASFTADFYGWVQVLGYNASCTVLPDITTAAVAGDTLSGANGSANAIATHANRVVMGTAPIYSRYVTLLAAVTTMTTPAAVATKVYVSCLE